MRTRRHRWNVFMLSLVGALIVGAGLLTAYVKIEGAPGWLGWVGGVLVGVATFVLYANRTRPFYGPTDSDTAL